MSALGALASQQSDAQRAEAFMHAALDLSRRDRGARTWLLGHELQRRRYASAFGHADALLRMRDDLGATLFPTMISSLRDPAAIKPLAATLAANPSWRQGLMQEAIRGQYPVGQVLLTEIQDAGGTVTRTELAWLLERLIEEGRYEQAYLFWLLFIPIDDLSTLRTVYDGDFDGWPEVYPFTWSLGSGVRGVIGNAKRYGRDEPALVVEYDGVSDERFPRQMVMLTPGKYRLSGLYFTTSDESAGRVKIGVQCQPTGTNLTDVVVPNTNGHWDEFAAEFVIPDGCIAQWLAIAPEPGERRASVEVWFDDIAIDSVGTQP